MAGRSARRQLLIRLQTGVKQSPDNNNVYIDSELSDVEEENGNAIDTDHASDNEERMLKELTLERQGPQVLLQQTPEHRARKFRKTKRVLF
ncbi:hypothetical protein MMC22_009409 [Lobaria immixta]|nr:hypothetical protein [Lobaria immixta]